MVALRHGPCRHRGCGSDPCGAATVAASRKFLHKAPLAFTSRERSSRARARKMVSAQAVECCLNPIYRFQTARFAPVASAKLNISRDRDPDRSRTRRRPRFFACRPGPLLAATSRNVPEPPRKRSFRNSALARSRNATNRSRSPWASKSNHTGCRTAPVPTPSPCCVVTSANLPFVLR